MLKISDVFAWARIIHVTQFIFSALCLYCFSKITFKLILGESSDKHIGLLALGSSVVWFLGNGTESIYQQSWINWYSVTYQGVSIPLFWICVGLTLNLLYSRSLNRHAKRLHILGVIAIPTFILLIHPTEFVFFAIYLSTILLFNWRPMLRHARSHPLPLLTVTGALIGLIWLTITYKMLPLPLFLIHMDFRILSTEIGRIGRWVTEGGGNRFPHAFSEAAIASLVFATILRIYLARAKHSLNLKVYDPLLASSLLFAAIPLNGLLSGTVGIVTHEEIVWRFFFGSAWFIFFPLALHVASSKFAKYSSSRSLIVSYTVSLLTLLVLSRFALYGSLYQNTASIASLLYERRIGMQYTLQDVERLAQSIKQQEPVSADKPIMLYIRGDLAPIVRTALRRYVYADRRRLFSKSSFYEKGLADRYLLVDIELPPDFPRDAEIFKVFALDKN
ncbi:MAG: hypothetical protein RL518_1078 [Pseudomonadota bacterium]